MNVGGNVARVCWNIRNAAGLPQKHNEITLPAVRISWKKNNKKKT
jgi:hypothetical protein